MSAKEKKHKVVEPEEVVDDVNSVEGGEHELINDNVTDESFDETDNSADLSEQVKMWQDKYIRLSAEFDNYRKRCSKEKLDLIVNGGEDVIKSLLVVIDDMERAIDAAEKTSDMQAMKDGIVLIYQKLLSTLEQRGLKEIESLGTELDTDIHEAVAKFDAQEDMKGKIIDVIQKGYRLKEKTIRFAKVVVGQ